jgi:hypothetical protein
MIIIAAFAAVVQVLLVVVVYVFHWMLVRRVPEGMGYDIEVKLLPPSIRVKLGDDDRG